MKKLAITLLTTLFALTTFNACVVADVLDSSSSSLSQGGSSVPEQSTADSSSEKDSSSEQENLSGMLSFTIANLDLEGVQYSTELAMTSINGMGVGYLQLGDYGNGGFQMRSKNGVHSAIWNVSAFPAPITKIVLTHSTEKDAEDGYAYSLALGTTADLRGKTVTEKTSFADNEWTIDVDGEYTYFQLTHASDRTQYWESIDVYYGGAPVSGETPGSSDSSEADSSTSNDSSASDPSTYRVCTIAQALTLADGTLVKVSGTVSAIDTEWSDSHGNISVYIKDSANNELYLYRLATKVELGDIVTVQGAMDTYNENRQIMQGATATVTGNDPSYSYREMTVGAALDVADNTNVIVQGKVTAINTPYSADHDNISVTITDDNDDSLYLYRLSGNVQLNDVIKVKGLMTTYNGERQLKGGTFELISAGESDVLLPEGTNGVHNVDFTKATNVKNVTDQGYYLDGCPTVGTPNILVIPVEFSDILAADKGYSLDKLNLAFNGGAGTTDYYSVKEYYKISSYGKLDLTFTLLNSWFKPTHNSSYYKSANDGFGDQVIMNEALAYLDAQGWDLSEFDSDDNGTIDAIVMISTLEIDYDYDFNWAYRYWNIYGDANDEYYEYDGVYANDYVWAPYQFLHEDSVGYDDKTALNTYTFIHEFGHVLGADDYYDTSGETDGPMDGFDVMDSGLGDHNAYSKFNYGWLTTSRLVVAKESVTLTLEDFSKNGDTILIANNWDDDLGAYQEYFIVAYYTNNGLNAGDAGYFASEGIVVYHVNASLMKENGYYDVLNNNTDPSDEYGSEDDLIEYVKNGSQYVYGVGSSLSANTADDSGEKIAYTFTVDSIANGTATLTFTPTFS